MASFQEEFFVERIKKGLKSISETLSEEEEEFLLTNVSDLAESDFSKEFGANLQVKCIKALSLRYQDETAFTKSTMGKDDDRIRKSLAQKSVEIWREMNTYLYEESERVISGIVQEWYLSVGRSLEKKTAGCTSVLSLILLIISAITLIIINT